MGRFTEVQTKTETPASSGGRFKSAVPEPTAPKYVNPNNKITPEIEAQIKYDQENAEYAGSFKGMVHNFIGATPKSIIKVGKDILQGTARSGSSVALSFKEGSEQKPLPFTRPGEPVAPKKESIYTNYPNVTKVGKFLFG